MVPELGGRPARGWKAGRDAPSPGDVARLLTTVPGWFGRADSNAEYVEAARTMQTWTVRDLTGAVVGAALIDTHFALSAEIHLMVVDRAWHGTGVGTVLIEAVCADLVSRGTRLLQVKTLGPSHPDLGYARTRHFYERSGFLPMEETDLWGADTPCLIMVKIL